MIKQLVKLILFLLFCSTGFAQQTGLSVEFISTGQGLPDKRIYCIAQDDAGVMWIGSSTGLYRYDGYNFVNYTHLFTGSGQKGIEFFDLKKTNDGLWVASQSGLYHFNTLTGTVTRKDLSRHKPFSEKIRRIFIDNRNRIWLYNDESDLGCFDTAFNLQFTYHYNFGAEAEKKISALLEDSDGSFWALTYMHGYDHLSGSGKFIAHYRHENLPGTIKKEILTPDGKLYHLYPGKQYDYQSVQWDTAENNFQKSRWNQGKAVAYLDRSGNRWLIDGEKITLVDTVSKKNISFTLPYRQEFISDYPTEYIYESNDNTIWFCNRKGIFKINYQRTPFVNYLTRKLSFNNDFGVSIRGMAEDDKGNIWIGSYPYEKERINLSVLDIKTNTVTPFKLLDVKGSPFDNQSSPAFSIRIHKNEVWHSSEGPYIAKTDRTTHRMMKYGVAGLGFPATTMALIRMNDSTVFLSSENTIARVNSLCSGNNCFTEILKPDGGRYNGISNFIDAGNGMFWATGKEGIFLLNNQGKQLQAFTASSNAPFSLPAGDVHHLYIQPGGILWLGTRHGLVKLDTLNKTSRVYTIADGLANNNVMGILPDEMGNLWMSTDNGLCRFNPVSQTFTTYDEKDELPHHEFNRMAYLRASDGRLYFGGLNGFTAFYPRDVDTSIMDLKPILLAFTKFDGSKDSIITLNNWSLPADKLTLNHNDKLFEFRFVLPAFRNPSKNKFLYKLEGMDENWQTLTGSSVISYDYLPPGSYTLRVKGATAGERWGNKEYTLEIIIHQAWFKTWWFFSLLALLAAAVLYALYRYRIARILQVQKIRNKISADLHDELGSVLTQISMQTEMVNSGIYTDDEKRKELENISATSRRAIHAMSDIVWSVNAGHDKIASLVDRMKDHTDTMLLPTAAEIEFTVSGLDEEKEIDNSLRQELFLIFKEAIHNIVKHCQPSIVQINMHNKNGMFELLIKNDINLKKDNNVPGGNGLRNMKKRAADIQAGLEIVNEGNFFTVKVRRNAI